jgi:hypothetical protein
VRAPDGSSDSRRSAADRGRTYAAVQRLKIDAGRAVHVVRFRGHAAAPRLRLRLRLRLRRKLLARARQAREKPTRPDRPTAAREPVARHVALPAQGRADAPLRPAARAPAPPRSTARQASHACPATAEPHRERAQRPPRHLPQASHPPRGESTTRPRSAGTSLRSIARACAKRYSSDRTPAPNVSRAASCHSADASRTRRRTDPRNSQAR